jgi:hypothetical protein
MLQWHSSNSSNRKLLTKHYPLFRINSFWKAYLFKSIMCLFHIMCLNNKLSGIDSIEPHLRALYHRLGIHLFSTVPVPQFYLELDSLYLISQAHQGAANGMSPCIFILASESYFLSCL